MPVVLTSIDYYIPGFKAGGPQRSLAYVVEAASHDFDFHIITGDRDLGDSQPYALPMDTWFATGLAQTRYIPRRLLSFGRWRQLLNESHYDVLYLNSFFSFDFTFKPLLLRWLGLIPNRPLILCARGELNPGAVTLKKHKKAAYIALTRMAGLYRDVVWQVTDERERQIVQETIGTSANIVITPNLPHPLSQVPCPPRHKQSGRLRIVFLSRIARKKNLHLALKVLEGVTADVEFDIYGPIEDVPYWNECRPLLAKLPPNVIAQYRGMVPPDAVTTLLGGYHLLFLPTRDENFGYVIQEALAAGCPPLLSDTTLWRGLAADGCGWDLPLQDLEGFRRAIAQCAAMEQLEFDHMSAAARARAAAYARHSGAAQRHRDLFHMAAGEVEQLAG